MPAFVSTHAFLTYKTPFGIQANDSFFTKHPPLKPPLPEENGKIKTLSGKGFMAAGITPIMKLFLEFAKGASLPVLDIGAAYGIASIAAIKQGNVVIANDLEMRHLVLMAQTKMLSKKEKERLYLNNDRLPYRMALPDKALDAVLMSEVLHFFLPEDIAPLFKNISRWLAPGGRLYLSLMSPYHYAFVSKGFDKIYEARWKSGDPWPGLIEDVVKDYLPEHKGKIPKRLHAMDLRPLFPTLSRYGFRVKKCFFSIVV